MASPLILMTDFGTADPFVGIMKGVIHGINPEIRIIDLTHEIPPGNIQRGAVILWQSITYFPRGSVFLAVVDPGVGTNRRPIFLVSQGFGFVGPDNGLFSFVVEENALAWELTNSNLALPQTRTTFHGRDIFAPAAAYAAGGMKGDQFGPLVNQVARIPSPQLRCTPQGALKGEILHFDRFGNALTSLGQFIDNRDGTFTLDPWVGECQPFRISISQAHLLVPNGTKIPWAATFADIPPGKCAWIIGSSGLIEIAANRQSAAKLLNLVSGDTVTLVLS